MMWKLIVHCVGGFYAFGRHEIMIHDHGILLSDDMVVAWEWPSCSRAHSDRMAVGE